MLASAKQILENAKRGKYAVGAFNVFNLETALGVIQGAKNMRSPVIVQISETSIKYSDLEAMTDIVKNLAKDHSDILIALHLDHGGTYELAVQCIQEGFTSVMIDGSSLPFVDNINLTKKVVQYAHKYGVVVQGELGSLPKSMEEARIMDRSTYMTDPLKSKEFTELTGVDFLAVAIGNVHGFYVGEPRLDFNRLKEIKAKIKVPLVLHGGSGIPPSDIREAISYGITEINIDTELRQAFTVTLRNTIERNKEEIDPRKVLKPSIEAVQEIVERKIRLFGSEGRV